MTLVCLPWAPATNNTETDAALPISILELKVGGSLHEKRPLASSTPRLAKAGPARGSDKAIIFLALFEANRGHPDLALQHMQGLRKTINALGGLQSLPHRDKLRERMNVLFFESSFAMLRGASLFAEDRRPWQPYYPWPAFSRQLKVLCEEHPNGFRGLLLERTPLREEIVFRHHQGPPTCREAAY